MGVDLWLSGHAETGGVVPKPVGAAAEHAETKPDATSTASASRRYAGLDGPAGWQWPDAWSISVEFHPLSVINPRRVIYAGHV